MKIYEVSVIDTKIKLYVVAEAAEQALSSSYAHIIKDYPECADCETEAQLVWEPADGVPFTFLTVEGEE